MGTQGSPVKSYDYLLKFLLVGDSDVGKGEILESLQDGAAESPYAYSNGIDYKTTTILLDGRRVKLELWGSSWCTTSPTAGPSTASTGGSRRLTSVQPAGPLLPGHRLLHPCAPHRQAPAACHHQEPPQVLLDGQRHECRHDARALLLAGQRGRGQWQQGQQSQEVQVHPPPPEPAPELLEEQLQDLLAGRPGTPIRCTLGGSHLENAPSWALGLVLCAGKTLATQSLLGSVGVYPVGWWSLQTCCPGQWRAALLVLQASWTSLGPHSTARSTQEVALPGPALKACPWGPRRPSPPSLFI
ncbi:ras-related protein Rab-40C isoform X1 [Diceros bicornis minor]|uniref:ras-related protein Rab-40C isoform X1 n=1 Tax=Diceros bicornis minor TaxID=77932 RepID=UPI0026F1A712|nr:ras-related protein Rab-40C isoform X1 [Diceros bicornis minor]